MCGIATRFSMCMYRMTVRSTRMEVPPEFIRAHGSVVPVYRRAWNCGLSPSMCLEAHGNAWMRVQALPIASNCSLFYFYFYFIFPPPSEPGCDPGGPFPTHSSRPWYKTIGLMYTGFVLRETNVRYQIGGYRADCQQANYMRSMVVRVSIAGT